MPLLLLVFSLLLHLTAGFEVFSFLLETPAPVWQVLPWSRLTTVCLAGWLDPSLVRLAHSHNTTVSYIANYPRQQLLNTTFRKLWVRQQVDYAKLHQLDGLNFDFEEALGEGSGESRAYTRLVKDTVAAFHRDLPASQVSIDFAWAPGGVDGRHYSYSSLGRVADLVFVMGYDEQSQMWEEGPCVARPNSPLRKTFQGVREYLRMGLQPGKMVLGVPWYGYRYPCLELKSGTCYIKEVPFRGCNCTDAAGKEFPFSQVLNMLEHSKEGRKWDAISGTPTFDYREGSQDYQVWYDDPVSLAIKYQVARDMGLRGTGFWTANFLNYSDSSMVEAMWGAIPP